MREQALKRTREEVPHSIEVQVEELERREDGLTVVRAVLWAETESQKAILIGAGGAHGARHRHGARKEIERELGRAHLDLTVKVRRWRRDEGLLDRLGIEAEPTRLKSRALRRSRGVQAHAQSIPLTPAKDN